jgi:hypothetical protein
MRKAIDSALDAVDDVARTIVRRAAPLPAGVSEELAIGLLDEPEGPVRRALRQLAWQQLVDVAPGASGLRYRSLDPVRQALAGELSPAARADGLTRATAALLGIARSIRPSLAAPIVVSRLEAVEDEHDNIRFVLADALVASPSAALDLAVAMAELWPVRGHIVEGRRWLIAAIDATGSEGAPWWRGTIALAKVTRTFAEMATMRSSLEAVVDAMRHDSDEPLLFGLGLLYLSIARGWQGDRAGAAVAIDEAAAIDRRDGTPWTAAHIEHLRAFDLALGGDLLGAREGQRTFARRMEALDDPFGAAMGWYLAASMGDLAGRSDLDDDISKARALATSTHDVALLGQLLRVEGSLLQRTGDARGRELLGEAADRLAAGGGLRAAALAWRDLGLLDLASGDDVAAAASLRRAVAALLHLERPAAALACAGLATIAQRRGEESASARLVAGAAALRTHETAAPAADAARLDALLADLPAAPHDAAINDDDVLEAADLLA